MNNFSIVNCKARRPAVKSISQPSRKRWG